MRIPASPVPPSSIRLALLLLPLMAACATSTTAQAPAGAPPHHPAPAASPANITDQLVQLRSLVAPFEDFRRAEAAGYGTRITGCDSDPAAGGQGYHYGNPALIDGSVTLLQPELLMYEPRADGSLRLVGVEYIIPFSARPADAEPPTLLGQRFHPNTKYNVWALHVWSWQANPSGLFSTWNPLVSCEHARD